MTQHVYMTACTMLEESLGPAIRAALADPQVTEIMVNPDARLWVERQGGPMVCIGEVARQTVEAIIRLAAGLDGGGYSREHPSVDATLPGGQRFHGAMPPRVTAPTFTIRTHQSQLLTREDYVPARCPAPVFDRLVQAVQAKETVLIAGMMSSGKSTCMSTLMGVIPETERVVTVEDVRELRKAVPNQVATFAPPSRLHEAIEEAWRSAAHRVLVSEIRSGLAALAALDVWMGLKGGLCTIHGKSARDALERLAHLCGEVSQAGEFRPRIGSVIDWVVYLEQVEGQRRIWEVVHLKGWTGTQYELDTWCRDGRAHGPALEFDGLGGGCADSGRGGARE